MSKIFVVLDPNNRYRNQLYVNGKLVADGNNGLEEVALETKGKRSVLKLSLSDFAISITNEECPELYRYEQIRAVVGDARRIAGLNPTCEMIRMSPNACDGCKLQPQTDLKAVINVGR